MMPTHRVAPLLALLLALFAPSAWAFLDPPYIVPANPGVGDTISVNVHGGECDLLNIGVVPPVISQQGNAITIVFTGTLVGDPAFCIYGIGTTTYPLNSFSAGSYTLQVDRRYLSFSAVWIQETLGVIPFTVTGGVPPPAPVSAPTLSIPGLSLLLLALAGIATRCLYSRRT
jgi:hypothetical protein